jgi:DNA (cytosine-5)-methyltransferase 1
MPRNVKIIDLFAGPGGLGEGFSAYQSDSGDRLFKIALSVENELGAQQTLLLRAFYRQFAAGLAPPEYYDFLDGKLGKFPDDGLFKIAGFEKQVAAAKAEARLLTLGAQNREINRSIEKALTKRPGRWVLIGGPPCQAYSIAGRSRNKGIKGYRIEADHRSALYKEYLKVIHRFSPAVFVMENVKGLLSAKHNGESIFDRIREDLANPGFALGGGRTRMPSKTYQVLSLVQEQPTADLLGHIEDPREFLIRSELYGVPQARHRVILLGVRNDIAKNITPEILGLSASPNVAKVIGDLPALRSGLSKSHDSFESWSEAIIENAVTDLRSTPLKRGSNYSVANRRLPKALRAWYRDPSGWKRICNHETRGHISSDLMRYLFCAAYSQTRKGDERRTPRAEEFPAILAPDHDNWHSGHFADRFRVQAADRVAATVTSHISKDGHYFIHYDPKQCRSLTVREAARIQTFPDNYFFVGNRTQQYVQVGNAVPPWLAKQIAAVVWRLLH